MFKKILIALVLLIPLSIGGLYLYVRQLESELPQILKVEDYKPLVVSNVFARGGEKIGAFYRENRILTPYEKIPKIVVQAFLAAEDDKFFEHHGINYQAIIRAFIANLKAGQTVQGGSTITQQVAKTFFLTNEKKLSRKIKEALLATELEKNLKKEEILYLYLNQIFFGAESYGVAAAADTYFRKPLDKITIAEAAMLAGLPQAPSRYSPTRNAKFAKDRQRYVLARMRDVGFITAEQAHEALEEPITVYMEKEYMEVAPDFLETVRQLVVEDLGEKMVLDNGIQIYTSLDYKAQVKALEEVRDGLKAVDKRQGYRGPIKNLTTPEDVQAFLLASRKKLMREKAPIRVITKEGNEIPDRPLEIFQKTDSTGKVISNLPEYVSIGKTVDAIVTDVDDRWGVAYVQFAEARGLLDVADMSWARKPDPNVGSDYAPAIKKVSTVLKKGDVILVKVMADKFTSTRLTKEIDASKKRGKNDPNALKGLPKVENFAQVALDQEPVVQGALLSFDQNTQDIVAMVGGYDFQKSKFNRTIQAFRQTGSSFKSIIYLAALDRGWNPAKIVADAPIVFEEKAEEAEGQEGEDLKRWKPNNYEKKFSGDVLFRTALAQSLNIPTVKILEDIGIPWAIDYSRRLGIFSPLNQDLSLSLGSSGVTLYEMTKAFSQIGRLGRRTRPMMVHKIVAHDGTVLRERISLDKRFQKELDALETYFAEKRKATAGSTPSPTVAEGAAAPPPASTGPLFFFDDNDQLIRPETAYVATSLLSATIFDENGTGARARALGRPVAGKTGTTNGYFDTWFVGYTPQYVTGVWVGFDQEKSLGVGEAGGRTAIPIWLEYMKTLHENVPATGFPVPNGIVFVNIDKKNGKLASARSKDVVNQAFIEGTQPTETSDNTSTKEEADFYKEDLAE